MWSSMICLFEMKLLGYYDLSSETWTMIVSGFLSFLLGILTIFVARNLFDKSNDIREIVPKYLDLDIIFAKDGKYLKNTMLILSLIGLFGAIQHWMVLLKMFGSVQRVLIQANIIYRMRIENEIPGVVPYVFVASYSAVFLAGVYTAYKSKFSLIALLPLIGVVLKDIANIGRAGILIGFFEFGISLFLFRYAIPKQVRKNDEKKKKNLILTIIIVAAIMIGSATLIRSVRGTIETYSTASRQLNKLRSGVLITPSIYLYTTIHIGVFNKYLEEANEGTMIGENTFLPVYSMIAKTGLVKQPNSYEKGYLVPIWSNSATYLRDLHADFGIAGVFIGPFLLGLFTTFYWFRFYERKQVMDFAVLVYLYLIVSISFLNIASRLSLWFLSLILLIIVITVLKKIVIMITNPSTNNASF